MTTNEFRVLVVCTANLCRSPMAEHLMRAGVARRWPSNNAGWAIHSAGLHAESGMPMHPRAAKVLMARGIEPSKFRSQRITRDAIGAADLVVTATREHRAAVVTLVPESLHYTFTLGQYSRMATAATPARGWTLEEAGDAAQFGREMFKRALQVRSTLQPVNPSQDDIADPIGRRSAAFRRCADHLSRMIDSILPPLPACW